MKSCTVYVETLISRVSIAFITNIDHKSFANLATDGFRGYFVVCVCGGGPYLKTIVGKLYVGGFFIFLNFLYLYTLLIPYY